MKKLSIIFAFFFICSLCFADDLSDYKQKVKTENLKSFFRKEVDKKYPLNVKVDALLGIEGNVGLIRSAIQKIKQDQTSKELEIDTCSTKECVNDILGKMKHE